MFILINSTIVIYSCMCTSFNFATVTQCKRNQAKTATVQIEIVYLVYNNHIDHISDKYIFIRDEIHTLQR